MPKIIRKKSIQTDTEIELLRTELERVNAEKDYIAMMTNIEIPSEEVKNEQEI